MVGGKSEISRHSGDVAPASRGGGTGGRPLYPRTSVICLRVHRAISGCRDRITAWFYWPDQRRAIRVGRLKVERRV